MDADLVGLNDEGLAVEAAVEVIERIAAEADSVYDVSRRLENLIRNLPEADLAADTQGRALLDAALMSITYMPKVEDHRLSFQPALLYADGTTKPPELGEQPDEVLLAWQSLRDASTNPVWRSRLGHLLVLAERMVIGKARVDLANEVAGEYLATPSSWGSTLDFVDALYAALRLTGQFKHQERRGEVFAAIIALVDSTLDDDPAAAGVTLHLIGVLVDQKDAPVATDALLTKARSVYIGSPDNLDQVFAQQLVRASKSPAAKESLWRERVEAWLDAAEHAQGILRAIYLQTAVEKAAASEIPDLRATATARLQQLNLADLELLGIKTSMILHGQQISESVRSVTDASTWTAALDAFALLGPISGDYTENKARVAQAAQQFPLSTLLPTTRFGGDGLPRFTVTTEEEKAEYRLAQQETFNLDMGARVVAEALLRLPVHHPMPSLDELAAHFARNSIVDAPLAHALARSFQRWWAGDYEGAGFTVAPRIETLARNLLITANYGIYRLQRQKAPGQYPGLGALLGHLSQQGMDPSWHRFLYTILASAAGWNLRNEISHGFVDDLDLVLSALLLQCAARLALFHVSPPTVAQQQNLSTASTDAGSVADGISQ